MEGDFNVTCWAHVNLPIGRNTRGMRLFNNIIDSANIMEIPLQNGRYTWSREGGSPLRSLLDRFFINDKWAGEFEKHSILSSKARIFFDHFPLLLEVVVVLWGLLHTSFAIAG